METFTYTNIFETKGLEYLVIITFLLLLIPFWLILNRRTRINEGIRKAIGRLTGGSLVIPQGIYFSPNHTWTHLSRSGIASVGIDDLLARATGPVPVRNLKRPGEAVMSGEPLFVIGDEEKQLTLASPVSGVLQEHNPLLSDDPSALSQDPTGNGWVCRIKPVAWKSETSGLRLATEATEWSMAEVGRLKDFLALSLQRYHPSLALVLQDGGELREHLLGELPAEVWKDFQDEFLAG